MLSCLITTNFRLLKVVEFST